jgi:hypothetical protein
MQQWASFSPLVVAASLGTVSVRRRKSIDRQIMEK